MNLQLPVIQYRGVPAGDPEGRITETWSLDPAQTALIELHCWNIGFPGQVQPPHDYWVFMGSLQNHEAMIPVVTDVIRPLLEAGRAAGLPIVHVQPESIAKRYPGTEPPRPEPAPSSGPSLPPATDDALLRTDRVHGEGYRDWPGWQELDVAPPVRPQPGDTMIVTTDQFDAWARSQGITTLLFTGFATNLCILDSPAAMKAMSARGYRCVLIREATLAVEFPETFADRTLTRASLQYIEAWVGYTAAAGDLHAGLSDLRARRWDPRSQPPNPESNSSSNSNSAVPRSEHGSSTPLTRSRPSP